MYKSWVYAAIYEGADLQNVEPVIQRGVDGPSSREIMIWQARQEVAYTSCGAHTF